MFTIYALGDFDIKLEGKSVLESGGYQQRLLKLFKYFMTFEGKRLLPENIIEDLWQDKEFADPKNVLRTQISRVRKMMEFQDGGEPVFQIDHVNGYYTFKINRDCTIDSIEFSNLMDKGEALIETNPKEALDVLKEGLNLYKGEYLPELEYEDWIVAVRNRYSRMYLKGLLSYLRLLKQRGMHHEIIEMCEKAVEQKPYEEILHIYMIEALMEIGQRRYGISHYEYITTKFYNDLGLAPSSNMKDLYKQLQNHEDKLTNIINLNIVDKELESISEETGALICDLNYFKFLYNWEKRNKDRKKEHHIFLGIISIENGGFSALSQADIKKGMSVLTELVYSNMRRGDVLSKWNDSQLLLLVYDIKEEDINTITGRLEKKYKEEIKNSNIILNIKFKSL